MCSRKCQDKANKVCWWRGGKYLSVPVTSLTVRIKLGVLTIHRAHDPQRTTAESRACTSKRNITSKLLLFFVFVFFLCGAPIYCNFISLEKINLKNCSILATVCMFLKYIGSVLTRKYEVIGLLGFDLF